MRRIIIAVFLVLAFAVPASATTDLGEGKCQQSDGQFGVWRTAKVEDDEACLTEAEYAELFSVDNLIAVGVYTEAVDNGDGTATVTVAGPVGTASDVQITIKSDPLEQPVAGTPSLEPDAPTVRVVLFSLSRFRPV